MSKQSRVGLKLVATPDRAHWARRRIDSALVKAIARARRWQRMLESGEYGSITEPAAAEALARGIDRDLRSARM